MITLVLGGTRSGKSEVAERLLAHEKSVTYIASSPTVPGDADWAARVERHRRRRPSSWSTVECGAALPEAIAGSEGAVLVDSLGGWVAATPNFAVDIAALDDALAARPVRSPVVLVSEEVGMAPHDPSRLVRSFVDTLGAVNQAVSARADTALLVVAGRVLNLDRPTHR